MVGLTEIKNFLESLYIDLGNGTGALKESPNVEATTIYTNTNYIALKLLQVANSQYTDKIAAFISQYDHEHYNRADILVDPDAGKLPMTTNKTITLATVDVNGTTYTIKAEEPTTNPYSQPYFYADISVYTALIYLWRKEFRNALAWREATAKLWDGKGFRDLAFNETHLYETYKLALYYYLMRALRLKDHITAWIEEHIDDFKDDTGGYITHYTEDLTPTGDPNVETTTIVGLAFLTDYPLKFPEYIPTPAKEEPTPAKDMAKAIETALPPIMTIGVLFGALRKIKESILRRV